jgi:hypothetical protein
MNSLEHQKWFFNFLDLLNHDLTYSRLICLPLALIIDRYDEESLTAVCLPVHMLVVHDNTPRLKELLHPGSIISSKAS